MADIQVKYTSDMQKLLRDQDTTIQKQQQQIAKLDATVKAAKGVGTASKDAMDKTKDGTDKANTSLSTMANSVFPAVATAATAAGAIVLAELRKIKAEADSLGDVLTGSFSSSASMASVAGGDVGKFKKLRKRQSEVFAAGAGGTLGEAADLVFALESASITGADETFAELMASETVPNVPGQIKGATAIRRAFTAEKSGSVREVLSKTIAASSFAPSKPEEVLTAAAGAGQLAGQLGFSVEETLANAAVLSELKGQRAESQLTSFLTQVSKRGLGKETLSATLEQFRGQSPEELFKTLGESQAVAFAGTMLEKENAARTAEATAAIGDAGKTDLLGRTMSLVHTDPELQAILREKVAKNRELLSKREIGTLDNTIDAIRSENRAANIKTRGIGLPNRVGIGLGDVATETAQMLGGEGFVLREMARAGAGNAAPAPSKFDRTNESLLHLIPGVSGLELLRSLFSSSQRQVEAAKALERAAAHLLNSRSGRPNYSPNNRNQQSVPTE